MEELAEKFDQKQIKSVLLIEHVSSNRAEQLALLPEIRKHPFVCIVVTMEIHSNLLHVC